MRIASSSRFRRSGPSAAMLLALGSCVAPKPPPAPEEAVRAPAPVRALPAAPVGEDWRDVALTPGGWTYRSQGPGGSIAQFGPAGGIPVLAMRCDAASRRVTVSREAAAGAPASVLGFVTSFGEFAFPVLAAAGEPPAVAASVPAADPNLDKLAFSRGRFLVKLAGAPRLVVPAWAEVGRVIEDCRG